MKLVEPKVTLIAATGVHAEGMKHYLESIGAGGFYDRMDHGSGSEDLIEVAGRQCYKSFSVDLNKNLSRVREGQHDYIGNVMKQKHGSVLEHASATLAFVDVSRIVTHELVRHRAGTAFSQESLRFVRLDALRMYFPRAFQPEYLEEVHSAINWGSISREDATDYVPDAKEWAKGMSEMLHDEFMETAEILENVQKRLAALLHLDKFKDNSFHLKKTLTSAFRRLAPEGLATAIVVTGNHRSWRHIIETRTAPGAEEEIRDAFFKAATIMKPCFPHIYQDMIVGEPVDGIPPITFANSKI